MKKLFKTILLAATFTLLMSISALAAGGGIYDLTVEDNVTVTPQTAAGVSAGTAVVKIDGADKMIYSDAERLSLTYANAASGSYYLPVVLKGDSAVPTSDNIVYINQLTADDNSVTFDLFPSQLVSGETYTVYLSSNDGRLTTLTKVATFKYYVSYTPGDVAEDGKIDISDAMAIINHIVGAAPLTDNALLAAEVTGDGNIDISDAMEVINYIVGNPQYLK